MVQPSGAATRRGIGWKQVVARFALAQIHDTVTGRKTGGSRRIDGRNQDGEFTLEKEGDSPTNKADMLDYRLQVSQTEG